MSQLYQLFCEGLAQAGKDGLSSTVIVTSTPLEDLDDIDADQDNDLARISKPKGADSSPSLSVRGQVGSATPEESPAGPAPEDVVKASVSRTQGLNKQLATQPAKHVKPLRETNRNVSPVDFVDRIIAVKHRDAALVGPQNRKNLSSVVTEVSEPKTANGRNSESSDTDFEGAAEYLQKLPVPSASAAKEGLNSSKNAERNRTACKSVSEESVNLVLDSLSSEWSECQSPTPHHSPSAARCRLYVKLPSCVDVPHPSDSPKNIANVPPSASTEPSTSLRKAGYVKENIKTSCQESNILNGVIAYVEVRSGHDNRSMGVRSQLKNLGATVKAKMCSEVTHVVFNEGAVTTLRRALKQSCHVVSVLWIEECKKLGRIAPENEHPPLNMHLYENPKFRRKKSLQPDFEEGKSEERIQKYVRRCRQKAIKASSCDEQSSSSDDVDSETEEDHRRKGAETLAPSSVALRPLSIVLSKIDALEASRACMSSSKRTKRKLMPLQCEGLDSVPLEDFDPAVRFRPQCPYVDNVPVRKKLRQRPSLQHLQRRSSCFVKNSQTSLQSQYKWKKSKSHMRTMVCTFMHRRDIDVVAAVIKQLGGWILEPTVSDKTTHVVCGDSKRTINLLKGIAHGCWILHQEWVMRSLEVGHWLDEEPFELTDFPAAQQCRIAKESLGVCPDVFGSAGSVYVAKHTSPPRSDIIDLLKLCGAHIVNTARQAKVIVGQYQRRSSCSDAAQVNEQWVLDSIQENMLQPMRLYTI